MSKTGFHVGRKTIISVLVTMLLGTALFFTIGNRTHEDLNDFCHTQMDDMVACLGIEYKGFPFTYRVDVPSLETAVGFRSNYRITYLLLDGAVWMLIASIIVFGGWDILPKKARHS